MILRAALILSVTALIACAGDKPAARATAAPTPTTAAARGVELAAMEPTVKPGDDFFAYANGACMRDNQIPPDKASSGAAAGLRDGAGPHPRDRRGGRARRRARRLRRAQDRRLLRELHGRGGDRGEGPRAARARRSTRSPRIARRRRALARALGAHAARRRRRAQQHQLLHRQPVRPLGRAGPDDPTRYSPSCCRAGSACPTATTTSTPRRGWPRSAPSTRRTSRPCSKLAGASPDAEAKAARIVELETQIAAGARDAAPRLGRRAQGQQPLDAAGLREARAGPRLGGVLRRAPGSPGSSRVRRLAAGRGRRASRRSCRASRSTPGRTTSPSTPSSARSAFLPKAFVDEAFAFYGKRAGRARRSSATAGSARVDVTNAALGEAVGKLYVAALLPARGEGAGRGDGEERRRRVRAAASTRSTGWRRRRRRRPRPSSRR